MIYANDVKPPCRRDCEGRHPGCHDSCEKYQEWKRAREERLAPSRFRGYVRRCLNDQHWDQKNYREHFNRLHNRRK